MRQKLKYVKTKEGEVIIFPGTIQHSSFKCLGIISAGFCSIRNDRKIVNCYGSSFSLNLEANVKEDSMDATRQVFGWEALLALDKDKLDE